MFLVVAALVSGALACGELDADDSRILEGLRGALPPRPAAPAPSPPWEVPPPAPDLPAPTAPPGGAADVPGEAVEIEVISGGEVTTLDETAVAEEEPAPMYRYFDASGALRMVRGIDGVPVAFRDEARRVADGGRLNRVNVPERKRVAFLDWQPEFNPNRGGGTVLFSAPGCAACARAEAHLDRIGVHYRLRDIQRDPAAKDHVRRVMGRIVVPLLKVGRRYVSGYLRDEYDRLAR